MKNWKGNYVNMVAVESLLLSLCVAFYTKLLLEHQDAIAPEKHDSLNELLELLGEVPHVESFLGKSLFLLLTFWVVFSSLVSWLVGFPIPDQNIFGICYLSLFKG